MSIGKTEKYRVDRETKLGYILTKANDDEEYFLHHNECQGQKLFPGDYVHAFLYVDKKNRVAATLLKPMIDMNYPGLVEVVGINDNLGVFMNIGISKDILLSKDDLPLKRNLWPRIGDKIISILRTKNNKLIIKIANKEQILSAKKEEVLSENGKFTAYVYRITPDGINVVTEGMNIVFIYRTNMRREYRLGEKIEVRIIKKNEEDYSGTLIENKEFQIKDDRKIILEYLRNNNGVMLITENSSPELINRLFKMSKAAFKKALGNLYRDHIIEIEEDKIILLEE
ncbi:MAG TPA: S1-like domain-containing RNA-binding protein [Bacilli bacterium]|nr:S1-like domain-containing RNA-binding protein [Bacilli bacterium]